MSADRVALRAAAEAWFNQDPDPETRDELATVLRATEGADAEAAWADLEQRFGSRLAFGTAGLRGQQGAGSNRMNRVLVAQAARGLADFLLTREATPTVVIGYDGRLNSDVYARDTAELMQAAGVAATLLPRMLPTPVLAFAVRELGASAGVMVTASHNPRLDNGYKVYLGGADAGSQIVPPADAEIAAQIERVAAGSIADLPRDTGYAVAGEALIDAYVAATAQVFGGEVTDLPFVYTAMHGVGWETFSKVLDARGIAHPFLVREQVEPDGTFPTVEFPNPEEPGALDLAFALAAEAEVGLVIAHDPDADRLAVAVPDAQGKWHRFAGNDIGNLLGWRAAQAAAARGEGGTLACSLVSSPALARVAAAYGLEFATTQTGFKWISRAPELVFGFEEALGYLVNPDTVRDKDGISAAMAVLELAMREKAQGRTLLDLRAEFAEKFGAVASRQVALRVDDVAEIGEMMRALRAAPPAVVGDVAVRSVEDLALDAHPADVLRLWLEDGTRVMIRPSGTEPKLKVYIDAMSDEGGLEERMREAGSRADAADAGARALLAAVRRV